MTVENRIKMTSIIKEKQELNKTLLLKLDIEIQNCNTILTIVKLKVSTLQLKMAALKYMHRDITKLRKIIITLHPHLKGKA